MALIAWYPLNGDTLDYSGNGVVPTITTNPIYSGDGKIGRCMTTGAFTLPSGVLNKNLQSICFWYYNTQSTPSGTGSHQVSGGSTRRYGLFSYPNNNDLHYSFYDETTKTNKISGVVKEVLACEEWTHVCLVNNNLLFSIYINGNLIRTFSTNSWDRDFNSTPYQLIHSSSYHRLNDVRIYDHALSEKEVKEISKAKVLHYTFDDFQEPTENLTQNILGYYTPYHTVVQSGNNFTCTMIGANKYIVMNLASLGSLTTRTFSYSGTMKKNGIPYVPNDTRFNSYNSAGSITNRIVNTETGYFEGTMYYNHATSNWLLHWPVNNNDGDIITITDFQIEEKDHATPFTPTSRQGIVRDISGYRNDAPLDLDTTPKWTDDSKIGSGAYEFDGNNKWIVVPNSQCKVVDEITVSAWAYKDNWNETTGERIISCTESGGWQLGFNDSVGYVSFPLYVNGVGYRRAMIPLTSITSGWHHLVGTFDGTHLRIYMDGKLKDEVLAGGDTIRYHATNGIFIGAEPAGSNTTPVGQYWKGLIDDVRIYATALSEEDIKELYQTRASVDSKGNVYACEVNELYNFLNPKLFFKYANNPSTQTSLPEVVDGRDTWSVYPAWFHPNRALNGLFKENTRYRIHFVFKHYSIYTDVYRTGGLVIYYTDGTRYNLVSTGNTGWSSIDYITPAGKTVKEVAVHYWVSYRVYIDSSSFIKEYRTDLINNKGILTSGEIHEIGMPIRYIRDTMNGSSANTSNHWVEIQAIDKHGVNVALGKTATSPLLIDGDTATSPYYSAGTGSQSVEVDLGEVRTIYFVKVWHYYEDRRTYHKTKTEVSADGVNWITIFDSSVEGEYQETAEGHTIMCRPNKMSISSDGTMYTRQFKEVVI